MSATEETIQKAHEMAAKNAADAAKKRLIPVSDHLMMPKSILLSVSDRGTRCRYKIRDVLNLPCSETEYKNGHGKKVENDLLNSVITVCGWSKTIRKQGGGRFCFVNLNDGSCHLNLQIVVDEKIENYEKLLKCGAGCCFRFTGKLIVSPTGAENGETLNENKNENTDEKKIKLLKRNLELSVVDNNVHSFEIYGENLDPHKYPLAKKNHTKEFLREVAHLRPRSYFISAVMRIRNALSIATHLFFQSRGFYYIHTPLITVADCEGGGEMFTVTALVDEEGEVNSIPKTRVKEKTKNKEVNNEEEIEKREVQGVNRTDVEACGACGAGGSASVCTNATTSSNKEGPKYVVDFKKDFFNKRAFLTVSGQLSVENYCSSMGDVYTFGPTFRAEKSHTSRHLAEFWMIEPELAFADLWDNMEAAESYIKYCIQYVLDNNFHDIVYFEENVEEGLIKRLKNILEEQFARITYTDAIELLKSYSDDFEVPVEWGMDLKSEHERFIAEQIFKKPVIVYNYPKDLKAFYMKLNEDKKTVAAMDVLVPKIGEVVGGSQREDNLELLDNMIKEKNLNMDSYWWYRELRKYGSHPHAGFGLGFERLVMMVTGVDNIRDTIPFPRYPGHADF